MSDELERQWNKEAESSFNEQDDGTGYYGGDVNYITGYVAGRKAAQEDISFWKKEYVSHSETMLNCQKEITALEARGKKLTEITSNQSDLLDEVEDLFGQHMEQRWHEKIKRAREILKDLEAE